MRIAFVIDSLGSGGAQRQLTELALRLRDGGHAETRVAVYHGDDFFAPRLRRAGVPVDRIPRSGSLDPRFPYRLGRWLRAERVDLAHAFLLLPSLWTLLATRTLPRRARPVLLAAERNSLIATSPREALLQRLVYRGCDGVTANAECAAREIREKLGVPAERVRYLPNGIDLGAWDACRAEAPPFPLEPGRLHLALVGGLRPQKNHALLFEALARVAPERRADWRVWCVGGETGGGGAAEAVREAVRRHGLEETVRLVPPLEAMAAFLGRLDGLVLPSRFEGFPNVVLEAMALGVPVVATAVGDVPNLVREGETGFVVPPGDAAALAHALERLAGLAPAARAELGARARRRVEERFSLGAVTDAHAALYRELLEGRSRA